MFRSSRPSRDVHNYHEIIELYNESVVLDLLFGLFACSALFFISLLINELNHRIKSRFYKMKLSPCISKLVLWCGIYADEMMK
jgi:hypothetical protein